MSTIFHAAWGLLLSYYLDGRPAVFGTTVTGRPAVVSGVEKMIGTFVNNLPVRLQAPEDFSGSTWLKDLQGRLSDMQQYDFLSTATITRQSGLERGAPLFDSLLLYQPPAKEVRRLHGGLEMRTEMGGAKANYPLTLTIADNGETVG